MTSRRVLEVTKHVPLPRAVAEREAHILERCRGRSVLHLGCADAPFLDERLATGTLLHAKLLAIAPETVGLDSDPQSVERMRSLMRAPIFVGSAESLSVDLGRFDVVVAGELIEHLNNPGLFLESVKRVLTVDGELIITTPNAFCLRRALRVAVGTESVHPDHVSYYSHATLSALLARFGFAVIFAANYPLPRGAPLSHDLFERATRIISPTLLEGLFYVAAPRGAAPADSHA
jgi:2-polyprenyl-3-methyl-5-hydroxy-6-metoxy-1,4-benzoquinol methylase